MSIWIGGDAARGAADLEVHVAEVVLVAEDVAQDGDLVAFLDEAHRDAGDRRLDRHAGVHERQQPPQTAAIEELPFDSSVSLTMRIVYGNLSAGGMHDGRARARRGRRGRSRGARARAAAWSRPWRRAGSCSAA
jgi:hypothetical protein